VSALEQWQRAAQAADALSFRASRDLRNVFSFPVGSPPARSRGTDARSPSTPDELSTLLDIVNMSRTVTHRRFHDPNIPMPNARQIEIEPVAAHGNIAPRAPD
jgi:hypothetical protein